MFRQMLHFNTVFLLAFLATVHKSHQDEVTSHSNQNISVNNEENIIKFGNTKTNNYNFQESNYQPSQHTQVVFNVGKWKGHEHRTRSTRPPTVEELAIKNQILAVYHKALGELEQGSSVNSVHLQHLERILLALNPKYIATRRVMDVAFADPMDTNLKIRAPESERRPQSDGEQQQNQCSQQPMIELHSDGRTPIQDQLEAVSERFKSSVTWDENFQKSLFQMPDEHFSHNQLAFKRLIQCLAHPAACKVHTIHQVKKAPRRDVLKQFVADPQGAAEGLVARASDLSGIRVVPPEFEPPADNEPVQQQQVLEQLNDFEAPSPSVVDGGRRPEESWQQMPMSVVQHRNHNNYAAPYPNQLRPARQHQTDRAAPNQLRNHNPPQVRRMPQRQRVSGPRLSIPNRGANYLRLPLNNYEPAARSIRRDNEFYATRLN